MEDAGPMPEKTGWSGTQVGVLVILLVVTNAVTGAVVFFAIPGAPAGPSALTVIHPWSGGERDLFLPVLAEFTSQTGIEIEDLIFRQEALQPILPVLFEAGRTNADLIIGMPPGFVKQFGIAGHLEDVSDAVSAPDYVTGSVDAVTDGTSVYGGPFTGKSKPGLWFKKSLFDANPGWDSSPATFAEFMTLLETIKTDTGTAPIVQAQDLWPLTDLTEYIIATYGGAKMHQDLTAGTLAWTHPTVVSVFNTHIAPLVAGGYMADPVEWTASIQDLWDEKNALYFQGSFMPTVLPDTTTANGFRVLSLGGGVADQGVVFGIDYMMIPVYSSLVPEARLLLEFLTGTEGQNLQIAQGGHEPTILAADPANIPADVVEAATSAIEAAAGRIPLTDLDDTVSGDWQQGSFWAQLGLLYTGQATVTAVLAELEKDRLAQEAG